MEDVFLTLSEEIFLKILIIVLLLAGCSHTPTTPKFNKNQLVDPGENAVVYFYGEDNFFVQYIETRANGERIGLFLKAYFF